MITPEEMRITRDVLQRLYDKAPETPEDLEPIEKTITEAYKNSMLIVLDFLNVVIDGERLEIFKDNPSDGKIEQ